MNGLAQVLLVQGCRVTGPDRTRDAGDEEEILRKLAAGGVRRGDGHERATISRSRPSGGFHGVSCWTRSPDWCGTWR
jgi:hypothetical protein